MRCYHGCHIPDTEPTFPAIRVEQKGRRLVRTESSIVRCKDKRHPPHTGWNWVDIASNIK